jgi:hypothetical protein
VTGRPDALDALNRGLAAYFGVAPAALRGGADAAAADALVMCGLLGGKGVGKSTLINALAGRAVSTSTGAVGEGTSCPVAYVHEDMVDALRRRLRALDDRLRVDVVMHAAEPLRNAALVDLPDFDSEFTAHLGIVQAVAPVLDRILWVLTPRKIGDRVWVEVASEVAKDGRNVRCVLNKVDELLTDADALGEPGRNGGAGTSPYRRAEQFWSRQQEWMRESLEAAGCSHLVDGGFMICAAAPDAAGFERHIALRWDDTAWSRYAAERPVIAAVARLATTDLGRLRTTVLGPLDPGEVAAIKASNRAIEQSTHARRLLEHYEVERTRSRLLAAADPEYYPRLLREEFEPGWWEGLAEALQGEMRPAAALADELLEGGISDWPLLRLVYWPFGWLSRRVGRRVAGRVSRSPRGPRAGDLHALLRAPLAERVARVRERVLGDHARVVEQFGLEADLPPAARLAGGLTEALSALPGGVEQGVLADIRGRRRKPSFIRRAALWLIALWFPLIQPVSEGVLQVLAEAGSLRMALGAYKVVAALSAVRLLSGLAVVIVLFLALIAGMHARAVRLVRRRLSAEDGAEAWAGRVDRVMMLHVLAPLAEPFQKRLDQLEESYRPLVEMAGDHEGTGQRDTGQCGPCE